MRPGAGGRLGGRRGAGRVRVRVLVRALGRAARALAHRRRVLAHAPAEPGECARVCARARVCAEV